MSGTFTRVVTIVVDQEAQTYEGMPTAELIQKRTVASRRAIEAYDAWILERDRVRGINRILDSRKQPDRRKAS